MSLIQCDEPCKFQKDGYCRLDSMAKIGTAESRCPYYRPLSDNKGNGLFEASDGYQF